MKIIHHRRNKIEELRATSNSYGVEVDIRSYGDNLVVHHDPFEKGEFFMDWISEYKHGTLILNVKEEGLETRLIKIMKENKIDDFFFLDQSFPFLLKTARSGEKRCAVRVSEFECIETALSLAGVIDWVWVDCFNRFPLSKIDFEKLKNAGFKLCLVSPELQGKPNELKKIKRLLNDMKFKFDAVCTKEPSEWN